MIGRWKTEAKFHLKKFPVVVFVWCFVCCLVIFLSATFIHDSDDKEDDDTLALVIDSKNTSDENKAINVFLIVCQLRQGGPSMVSNR